ncbi:ATP-binding protein [Nocardia mexicana]|uniref:Regulatory LuxR family protein n=1 Tax=Nocardia mexicana TaxID=279262 RepID=A0A370GSR4_9NOCA|nr:helix-turn-helix transcriptional regulator [Nocardia mexicana]RDI46742.1 regulatory LuxR family protein [Nocardia mexicana]
MLSGRYGERAEIDRLLADAAGGSSRALVLRGEAGIGKSALVEYAADAAAGMRVVRGVGVESEAELAFGALHLLLYPYLDRLDTLPGPQAAALRAAFGQIEAPEANRFLVGAATLTLLAELAAETPTLVLVDDAQWLDRSSSDALLFATRRFHADPIAVVLAVRETALPFATPGLDTLRLNGLPRDVAAELLDERAPGLTVPGRERVLAESAGNPLALIELGTARRSAERAGNADPVHEVGPLPVARRVQDSFRAQIAELPTATGTLLLIAAADAGAGVDTILRVATEFGLTAADLEPAEHADLVIVSTDRLSFRHPLIRAAAYQQATHHQRIAVHETFARALTADAEADRRAWHLAAATTGPDETVAEELESTARRAQYRGGAMAVSAAYDRAGRLSIDPEQRARRLLLAARAAYDAGRSDRATRLAGEAASLTADSGIVADATHIKAQIEYERTSPAADAELALTAADLVVRDDPERAVFILTEAVCCARDAGRLDLLERAAAHLKSLHLTPDSPLRPHVAGQVAWADFLTGRPESAVDAMVRQLGAAHGDHVDNLHKIAAAFSGVMLADDAGTAAVMDELLDQARGTGAVLWIPYSLEFVALSQLLSGQFVQAETSVAEGVSLCLELELPTEAAVLRAIEVWLAAVTGDEERSRALAAEVCPYLSGRHPTNGALASWGLAIADLAAGRFDAALDALDDVCTGPAAHDFLIRAVPDHVEAAVRAGQLERARDHLPAYEHWAQHVRSPLGTALVHRCRALLSAGDDAAEEHYLTAARLHEKHGGPYDRARTQLVFGEWLRRRRRRSDARSQLVEATDAFDRVGARVWADRARVELAALGEQPTTQRSDPLKLLTPQEVQVIRLAAAGHSNKEIGARLFLSPRTVGHHLYKAYPKLGVTRRIELAQLEL